MLRQARSARGTESENKRSAAVAKRMHSLTELPGTCWPPLPASTPIPVCPSLSPPIVITKALEETAAQNDVEVRQSFETRDRHVASVILALHADLEDDGESPITALAVYLQKRYGVFRPWTTQFRGGMPATRLKRVLKFIGEK